MFKNLFDYSYQRSYKEALGFFIFYFFAFIFSGILIGFFSSILLSFFYEDILNFKTYIGSFSKYFMYFLFFVQLFIVLNYKFSSHLKFFGYFFLSTVLFFIIDGLILVAISYFTTLKNKD